MRRLSIIDLEGGDQPMTNESDTVHAVFNGEIYNFAELRDTLLEHGHKFRTRSDTETIVHAYEHWGDDFVTHLNGMFAIALWDEPRRRLLLVRDRAGIKPLYYARTNGALVFASEVKALLRSGLVARDRQPPGTSPIPVAGIHSGPRQASCAGCTSFGPAIS